MVGHPLLAGAGGCAYGAFTFYSLIWDCRMGKTYFRYCKKNFLFPYMGLEVVMIVMKADHEGVKPFYSLMWDSASPTWLWALWSLMLFLFPYVGLSSSTIILECHQTRCFLFPHVGLELPYFQAQWLCHQHPFYSLMWDLSLITTL